MRERARVGDARVRKRGREREERRLARGSERSERGREDTRARKRERVHARERARMSKRGTEKKEERERAAGTTTTAMGASSQQRQQWGLRGRGLERRCHTAGPARIDAVDVPARLWSTEGRRGRAPTSAGTDRRGTGQAVGEVRWDAGVHGQDFPRLAPAYRCVSRRWHHFFFRYLNCQLLRP